MDELVLNPERIEQIETRDHLFGRKLGESRRMIVRFIRQAQPYISAVFAKMQAGDVYRARIPRSVIHALKTGQAEMVLKKDSGLWTGIIRKSDGSKVFVSQTEWEPASFDPNVWPDLFNQVAIQAGIAAITEQLFTMNEKLDLILSGQHLDRVALVESAIEQYEKRRATTRINIGVKTNSTMCCLC